MKIKTTASGNFENKKPWSGLQKHMEHDPELDHDNSYLNTEESKRLRKYNRHKILIDYDSWTEKHFGAFVKQHDETIKDKRRRFGSVKRFLKVDDYGKLRKTVPDQAFMEKLSNEEDFNKFKDTIYSQRKNFRWNEGPKKGQPLTKEELDDKLYTAIAQGLADYAEGFNKRNSNLFMFRYDVHVDEEGAPHLHSRVMPFYQDKRKTKKGRMKKPSWSLNKALGVQYKNPGKSKANLKRFRDQEDKKLIECVNKSLEQSLGLKNVFELIRKTDKDQSIETGLAHKEYKAKKAKMDEINSQLETGTKLLALSNKFTPQLQKTLENQKKQIEDNQKTIDEQNKVLGGYDEFIPLKGGGNQKRHVPSLQEKINRKQNELDSINHQKKEAQKQLTEVQNALEAQKKAKKEQDEKEEKLKKDREKLEKDRKNWENLRAKQAKKLKEVGQKLTKRESRIKEAEKAFYITFLADFAGVTTEEVAQLNDTTKKAKNTFKNNMLSGSHEPLERQAKKAHALFKGAKAFMKRIVGIGDDLPEIEDKAFVVPAFEKEQEEKTKEKASQPVPEQEPENPDF